MDPGAAFGKATTRTARMLRIVAAALCLLQVGVPHAAAPDEQRLALIIGNGHYAASPLTNPVNDARAMGRALQRLGFRVTLLEDASLRQMLDAARTFGDGLRQGGGVGLFYYAGHGMQIKGRNFLVPVGADIQREDDVALNALDAGQLLDKMEAAHNRVNIIILDACRNNPFARSFRSGAQGLAQMEAPVGSYLSFATAPGRVASDGQGGNGLYTHHLLEAMNVPGLTIEDVFKRVRVNVMADSQGQQVPWDNSSLSGDFYFLPAGAALATPGQADRPVVPAQATAAPVKPARAAPPPARPAESKLLVSSAPSGTGLAPAPKATGETAARLYQTGRDALARGDFEGASTAYAQAAEYGHAGAQYEYGLLLKTGRRPVAQDLPHAYRVFLQAARQGNNGAQFEVAQLLGRGMGVEKNCQEASQWAKRAAEGGSAAAAAFLGDLNQADCGGRKNLDEAARWYRVAAEKGIANAQFSLGLLYMNGDGVPRNIVEARRWLTSASGNGNSSARFYLDRIGGE
jgi:TPR repeat protein